MKLYSLALASAAVGTVFTVPAPALAQSQPAQPQFKLSKAEQAALKPLLDAANAATAARAAGQTPDWAKVRALLPAAQAVARSNDARYLVAKAELSLALAVNDEAAQERLVDVLLANPTSSAEEKATYRAARDNTLNKRAEQAFQSGDYATAERIYREILQSNPNDARVQGNLAIVQRRSGNTAGALEGTLQQIRAAEAAGRPADERLYLTVFETHYLAKQRPQALASLTTLLRNYPNQSNWQRAVRFVNESRGGDKQLTLDTLRLALITKTIEPQHYLALATELNYAGLPGETKAVIDAGIAAGAVQRGNATASQLLATANRRIAEDRASLPGQMAQARRAANGRSARIVADALFGYGRHSEAAELYRLALTKGGEDANLVNTRLGASLALAGDRAGAEAALRAVTGTRAELAQLWLAWLGRRTA
jgi:hypothetical protein